MDINPGNPLKSKAFFFGVIPSGIGVRDDGQAGSRSGLPPHPYPNPFAKPAGIGVAF